MKGNGVMDMRLQKENNPKENFLKNMGPFEKNNPKGDLRNWKSKGPCYTK